jgi:hypothetical protein
MIKVYRLSVLGIKLNLVVVIPLTNGRVLL